MIYTIFSLLLVTSYNTFCMQNAPASIADRHDANEREALAAAAIERAELTCAAAACATAACAAPSIKNTMLHFTEPILDTLLYKPQYHQTRFHQDFPSNAPCWQWEQLGIINSVKLNTPYGPCTIMHSTGPNRYPIVVRTLPGENSDARTYANEAMKELQESELLVAYVFRCSADPAVFAQFHLQHPRQEYENFKKLFSEKETR